MREKVKEKQKAYAAFSGCTSKKEKGVRKATSKAAKKLVKKVVTIVKNNTYERLYQKLETKEGEKDVFKLARARERKTRDLECIRRIKGDDGKVLVQEAEIRERWRNYFCRLFNGGSAQFLRVESGAREASK